MSMQKTASPSPTLALARKELYTYSISPAFYGIALFFLLFTSIWLYYFQAFFSRDTASLRAYFVGFPLAFILVIPALTMKSWAEERKVGSYELLLTMPFSEWNLVLGKFLASFTALAAILALTIPVPISVAPLGRFDAGVIISEYLGILLLGASATALGLLLSALSRNQAAAFLGSAVAMVVVILINEVSRTAAIPAWLSAVIGFMSLSFHFETFAKGILDSRDLAYFVLSALLFLFITTRVLYFRKWR